MNCRPPIAACPFAAARFLARSIRVRPQSAIANRQSPIRRAPRGSVLVIVMVTLIFTALALTAFLEKAGNDLILEAREADTRRLRQEAYSALETTLAVIEQFRAAGGGLHTPAEGWADPLGFAAYVPTEGCTVEVAFEDESGKLSLPQAGANQLQNLFVAWALTPSDAEKLTDVLLGWIKKNHTYTTAVAPDYEHAALPYAAPQRSLRSFGELAAIDYARTVFFDEAGRPNDLYRRFTESVSLINFRQSNLNGAKPDVLTAVGEFDDTQKSKLGDYLAGTGASALTGPAWFTATNDARKFLGSTGRANAFGTTISALRIRLTVREGRAEYRLNVVVAPSGSNAASVITTATTTRANASDEQAASSAGVASTSKPTSTPTSAATAAAPKLNYPFTLLSLAENEPLPPPPPPPPAT
jgi:general secretion pathway protein K